jgi:2-alkenal reductase
MKRISGLIAFLIIPAMLLSACSAPAQVLQAVPIASAAAPATTVVTTTISTDVAALEATLEQVYTQVSPSVVTIHVMTQQAPTGSQGTRPFGGQGTQPYSAGLGSGFVLDKSGNIVTNNHVIDGATTIRVVFADGTMVDAKLVGADPYSDLAVIKVDVPADQLKPVEFGDSTAIKVGQIVIAIGNPFGEQNTMTMGIVSALGRTLPADNPSSGSATASQGSYTIPDVIQTDASINPGNSGGVLVDIQGHLLGVTAAIESSTNSSAGIGFAIPVSIVRRVVPVLAGAGVYQHSYLGLSGGALTPDLAKAMNLPASQRGALVATVVAGGPSAKAGLKPSTTQVTINGSRTNVGGDVIVAIDGKKVKEFDDIISYLASSTEVGQTVTLTVLREGSETKVQVKLEARPGANKPQASITGTNGSRGAAPTDNSAS